jgi:hypothetical protein
MSLNIVSIITQFLTPEMIAKIASSLGIDKSLAGKAIGAAVPSLLGGLAGVAGTQDGAQKLYQAVTQQHSGVLESLAGMIGGSGQATLVDNGTKSLSSLLGPSTLSGLGGALNKYSGLGGTASASLLGLLAPVVMGTLGKQASSGSLNAGGLASMLTSQKSNISAAIPSGFADMISGTGLLKNLGAGVAGANQTVRAAAQSVSSSADSAVKQASGLPGWAQWALPVIVIAALAWWFLGNRASNVAEQAKNVATQATQTAQTAADAAKSAATQATQTATDATKSAATQAVQSLQNLVVGGVDVGSSVQKSIDGLKTALQGIKDVDTARAALPTLQDSTTQFDKLSGLANQLPASGTTALAAFLVSVRPSIDEVFIKVLAIPGVSEVAKPTIDTIKTKLDDLAKA